MGDFLVSGYVADEKEWPCVASAWQERVLDGPPKLPYLHMSELRNEKWRDSLGITHLDSQDRVDEAVRLLSHAGCLSIVASVINRSDLASIIHSRYKRKKDIPIYLVEPDYFCFLGYSVYTVVGVHKKYPNAEKVNFVVSRKQNVTHHLHQAHIDARNWLEDAYPQLKGMMGEIIPACMENRLPLQCADVICWHQQRHYAKTAHRADYKRLMRLGDIDGHTHQWELKDLWGIADRIMPLPPKTET